MKNEMYLATEAGEKLNGTTWTDEAEMLAAVRAEYGPCDFAVTDGSIITEDGELVATFGRN